MRFDLGGASIQPDYNVPFEASDIIETVKVALESDCLCVSYVMLNFFSVSMWPEHVKDCKHPFDTAYLYCVGCGQFVGGISTVCLQLFVASGTGLRWTWIPRLLCNGCRPVRTKKMACVPIMLYFNELVQPIIKGLAMRFEQYMQQRYCSICDASLSKKQSKRSHRKLGILLCSKGICGATLSLICSIDPNYITNHQQKDGLYITLRLLEFLTDAEVNVNQALAWGGICTRCLASKTPTYYCTHCYVFTYCSRRCRDKHQAAHRKQCPGNWRKTWSTDNLIIKMDPFR